MKKLPKALLLLTVVVFVQNGCTDSVGDGLPGKNSNNNTYHPKGWKDNQQHGIDYSTNPQNCNACHGNDLRGGSSGVSCVACHHNWSSTHGAAFNENPSPCQGCHGDSITTCADCHHSGWSGTHGEEYAADPDNCKACHGEDLQGGSSGVSCVACHHDWDSTHAAAFNEDPSPCQGCHGDSITTCADCHHSGWSGTHPQEYAADPDNCKACHGDDLNGEGDQDRDCGFCHHEEAVAPWQHGDYHTLPDTDNCTNCHGADFTGANSLVSCFSCHSSISAFDCADCHTGPASSYTDSAHGSNSDGVNRSGTDYTKGDCTHCHDLPAGETNDLLLFAPVKPTSQDDNFCFKCHKEPAASVQTGMPNQYSYSRMAGGDVTLTTPDDILEAFSSNSSHNLSDISTLITGKWGYTAASNPCNACHNPHAAERDPHTDPDSGGSRGWPVSLPSDHTDTSTWGLWGDVAAERMKQYITDQGSTYQAPNSASGYEPDGSTTQDGSNLTDYVTFCLDCHTDSVGGLAAIDWSANGDKHGRGDGTPSELMAPYSNINEYTLSCLDCHEPHGSSNIYLLRQEVNTKDVSVPVSSYDNWTNFCIGSCHSSKPHGMFAGADCSDCHYHGDDF